MANWKIESMVVKPVDGSHTDVVVTAAWRCTAVDGDHSASNYGSMGFASPSGDFVAYQNIIPILVKAIQELEAKVAALEAK